MSQPTEDIDLASEQFVELNQTFYRGNPHGYLKRRLLSLVLVISDSESLRAALTDGISFGSLTVNGNVQYDADAAKAYAALEATTLFHHAAEALLRLFIAHRDNPPCPWLDIVRLRNFKKFKDLVAKLRDSLASNETQDALLRVFLGSTRPSNIAIPEETWEQQKAGISLLVYIAATHLLDESNLYNASKHGLAVVGEEAGVSLGDDDLLANIDLSVDGPSLTYLQAAKRNDVQRWEKCTKWTQIEGTIGLIHLIVDQIGSLWAVARMRYISAPNAGVAPINTQMIEHAVKFGKDKIYNINTVCMQLLYYEPQADLEPE